jgi:hypothetical protein
MRPGELQFLRCLLGVSARQSLFVLRSICLFLGARHALSTHPSTNHRSHGVTKREKQATGEPDGAGGQARTPARTQG